MTEKSPLCVKHLLTEVALLRKQILPNFSILSNSVLSSATFKIYGNFLRKSEVILSKIKSINQNHFYSRNRKEISDLEKDVDTFKKQLLRLKKDESCNYNNLTVIEENMMYELKNLSKSVAYLINYPKNILGQFEDLKSVDVNENNEKALNATKRMTEYKLNKKTYCAGQFMHKWNKNDHNLFLKICLKPQNKSKLLETLISSFPHLSYTVIKNHLGQYNSYKSNLENVKGKISEWKTTKSKKKFEEHNKSLTDFVSVTEFKKVQNKRQLKSKVDRDKIKNICYNNKLKSKVLVVKSNALSNEKLHCFSEKERATIKEKLEVYKRKKEEKLKQQNVSKTLEIDRAELRNNLATFLERDKELIQKKKILINKSNEKDKLCSKIKRNNASKSLNTSTQNYKSTTESFKRKIALDKLHNNQSLIVSVDYIPRKKLPNRNVAICY